MKKDEKTMVHLSRRKKIGVVALILVILALLEVYFTYVQIHDLQVVTVEDALRSFPFGQSTGTYTFSRQVAAGSWSGEPMKHRRP